jgi:hypothetical protein
VKDHLARETFGTGDGLVWTGIVRAHIPLQQSASALDGVDFLDSEIFDAPWDDLSGGTTHVSAHALVVPRNTIHSDTL